MTLNLRDQPGRQRTEKQIRGAPFWTDCTHPARKHLLAGSSASFSTQDLTSMLNERLSILCLALGPRAAMNTHTPASLPRLLLKSNVTLLHHSPHLFFFSFVHIFLSVARCPLPKHCSCCLSLDTDTTTRRYRAFPTRRNMHAGTMSEQFSPEAIIGLVALALATIDILFKIWRYHKTRQGELATRQALRDTQRTFRQILCYFSLLLHHNPSFMNHR